jgi:hypothetical protein
MKNLDAHFDAMLGKHLDAQDVEEMLLEDAHAEVIAEMARLTRYSDYGYHGSDFVAERLIGDQAPLLAALAKNDDKEALRILKAAFNAEVEALVDTIVYK